MRERRAPCLGRALGPSGGPLTRPAYLGKALGIALATGVYGISFGALAVSAGLSVAQACAMSLLVFTGGSQFAAVGVIGAGGAPVAAVTSGLLLGARNIAYGLSMAPLLAGSTTRRLAESHLVIDESTAMARSRDDPVASRGAFLVTGLSIFALWNAATLIGAAAGNAIDPERYGLDAMFPAAFLALLAPQLRQASAVRIAVVGGLIALVLTPLVAPGIPVIAAALAVLLGLRRTGLR